MNFRQGNESAGEIHEFPNFRWHPENMNFRQGNESTTEIHEFPNFRWHVENMNFRQGNESATEIHDFPNFRWHVEKWISVKEMKFMNFRISVDMLKTWISVKEMKVLQKFMNFRISVDMLKNEFPSRKWNHYRNSWISEFLLTCWKMNFRQGNEITTEIHEFPNFRWHPENMNFRQGNESTTEIHEFPNFRWHPENMNFRQGNESTTEIHEFPNFRWHPENMNFRQGNESTTEIHDFPNFRMVQLNSCRVHQNNKLVQLNWFHVYDFPHRCSLTIFRIHVDRSTEKRLWIHPIYKYVTSIGIPYLIGGDFNMPPQSLPIWSAFKDIGAVEAFELFRHRNLVDLPPTCRGSTRHDTCIIHPFLARHISDMDVLSKFAINDHTPLRVHFDFSVDIPFKTMWKIPKSWHKFELAPHVFEDSYDRAVSKHKLEQSINDDTLDSDELLRSWSKTVEDAVNRTMTIQHQIDPIRFPDSNLPDEYRGRCKEQVLISQYPKNFLKEDALKRRTLPMKFSELWLSIKWNKLGGWNLSLLHLRNLRFWCQTALLTCNRRHNYKMNGMQFSLRSDTRESGTNGLQSLTSFHMFPWPFRTWIW